VQLSSGTTRINAAVFTEESGKDCAFRELNLQPPNAGELLIKSGATGICHTDIAVAEYIQRPALLGHELAGEVVGIGDGVTDFQIGDRIVATFGYCGECGNCHDGAPAYCNDHERLNFSGVRPDGSSSCHDDQGQATYAAFFQQSGFADYALVQAASAVKLPDEMSFDVAAPLGCGVQTGAGAVFRTLDCQPGKSIVIFGLGSVGLIAVMAAKLRGCDPIIAVDIAEDRMMAASTYGAHHTLDGRSPTLLEGIQRLTAGGAHYSIEGTGNVEIYQTAIKCLRPKGVCGLVALPGEFGAPVPHPGGMSIMNTRQIGIVEGDSDVKTFLPELIELQMSGALPYDQLITRFDFKDINQALDALREKRVFKPVLMFSD